jgi:D-glycero-D-manno-heptose 1,7-bisphosphate phosphatase
VTAAVFVDRDGVLNELVPDIHTGRPESPLDPRQVALIPGAAFALRRLHNAGYVVVGVSNQPAAAKGTVDIKQLESVQARVLDLLERAGAAPDAFRLCFHHPEGVVPELTSVCDCRKPAPGMLLDASAELDLDLNASWMIGDTDADVLAGAAAGSRTISIENLDSAHKRSGDVRADATALDLAAAADLILITYKR